MTRLLADVASYQGNLTATQVKAAGFTAVNFKISHGVGQKSVHPELPAWIASARASGLGICTFHYFTTDASGEDQAAYAYSRLAALGLLYGTAHQLDVECTPAPTLSSVRAYLSVMESMLQRPLVLYTGDWWWTARSGWNVSDLTPYLWAAPNQGYLGKYPGDSSSQWRANYGGWPQLSVMQYAVAPIAGIDASMSAVADEKIWTRLTKGDPGLTTAPARLLAARAVMQRETGLSAVALGITGDTAHSDGGDSYHLGADQLRASASYSKTESPRDSKPTNEASALDVGWWSKTIDGITHNLRTFSVWLVEQCKAQAPDTLDIREMIYSPDGKTVKRWDRLGKRSTGDDSHLVHTHISEFRDAKGTKMATLFERYWTEIKEGDMPTADEIATAVLTKLKTTEGRLALANGVWNTDDVIAAPGAPTTGNTHWAGSTYLPQIWNRSEGSNKKADQVLPLIQTILPLLQAIAKVVDTNAAEDRAALTQVLAAIDQVDENVLNSLGVGQTDQQVAVQLVNLFGTRAGGIAQAMAQQATIATR